MIPLAIAGLFLGLFTLWVVAPRKFNRGKSGRVAARYPESSG
jgi:hypothetical protein